MGISPVDSIAEIFDDEVQRAIFATRLIQEIPRASDSYSGIFAHSSANSLISRHLFTHSSASSLVSRYLESRSLSDFSNSNQFTAAIRRTAETLVGGIGTDTQHTWVQNIRGLCHAATIHLLPGKVLSLLDSKENESEARNHDESIKSIRKSEDEIDVFVGAAYTGNIAKVREMLAANSRDMERGSRFFGYPLQCACSGGFKDIVTLLLEHGADIYDGISRIGDDGIRRFGDDGIRFGNGLSGVYRKTGFGTPLQSACLEGHEDIVSLLLERKYKPSQFPDEYHVAVLQAARGGNLSIVTRLLKNAMPRIISGKRDLLSEASKYGQKDFVRKVLNKEAFRLPDLELALSCSLYEAANRGHHEIVQLLLSHGTERKRKLRNLWRPFSAASRGGYERVVRLILEHRWHTNGWSNTLVPAASKGQVHMVSFSQELDPEGCSSEGVCALKEATEEGYESVVRLLVDRGFSLEDDFSGVKHTMR